MANVFTKAERIVRTQLGLLEREVVLPRLVWRDAVGDFKGAKNDTVTIRLPAFMEARTRALRSAGGITVDDLTETTVDVTLDTEAYKAVGVTLEELTLDIESFEEQVVAPTTSSVARKVEDALASFMNGTSYAVNLNIDEDDPYLALVDARKALNKANVPVGGRFLAVGADVEAAILKSDRLSKFDSSGSDDALREAMIGRIAGFSVVTVPGLDPELAIAGHQTAFVLSTRAPAIPQGATAGARASAAGFAMSAILDYDFINQRDRYKAGLFMGINSVKDRGTIDVATGKFTPSVDGNDPPVMVRAVKLGLGVVSS